MRVAPRVYCIWALLLLLAPAAGAQPSPASSDTPTGYTVFLQGMPVGRENVTIRSDATTITIVSNGRLSPPFNILLRNAELRYSRDWMPQSVDLDASINGADFKARAQFKDGTAAIEGSRNGKPFSATANVSPTSFVMPDGVFGAFAALARRLTGGAAPSAMKIFVFPTAEIDATVDAVHDERMQIGTAVFNVRRFEMAFANPAGKLPINMTATTDGSLLRVSLPTQGLDIVREDVAASTSRTEVHQNAGDEAVIIPATGFNLGATLTRPRPASQTRLPAVVLLGAAGVGDRDGTTFGVPTLAQLASTLSEAGFLVVRYDTRGFGQSGGRAESATLDDAAMDARDVVKWLAARKDVDPKRIALVGHSEGAAVALLAASREKRIAAVVSIAGPASTGAELNLEQQQDALDRLKLSESERAQKIAQQKQIQTAVLTGKGWEGIPPELRRQADTPWFQSFLTYDPAKTLDDVRQPLLIVHGELDRQVPVSHADRLATLARQESKSKSIEVVVVRGVNHLLVPATTGEVSEYATLTDRSVSKDVTGAIITWLTKTFAAIK